MWRPRRLRPRCLSLPAGRASPVAVQARHGHKREKWGGQQMPKSRCFSANKPIQAERRPRPAQPKALHPPLCKRTPSCGHQRRCRTPLPPPDARQLLTNHQAQQPLYKKIRQQSWGACHALTTHTRIADAECGKPLQPQGLPSKQCPPTPSQVQTGHMPTHTQQVRAPTHPSNQNAESGMFGNASAAATCNTCPIQRCTPRAWKVHRLAGGWGGM